MLLRMGYRGTVSLQPLQGGGNNRVYRADADNHSFLLKVYFHHSGDNRNRLETEFSFSGFAWACGVRSLPQPMMCDPIHHLGLYEFIRGCRLLSHEVTSEAVHEALRFYLELNKHKHRATALGLPSASEACLAIADHLRCVQRRIDKLMEIQEASAVEREAVLFIRQDLFSSWNQVMEHVFERSRKKGLQVEEEIDQQDRCLSPSDFGFHNAIVTSDGQLKFIDFEYAGWDDPAKMVCDFFCQPAIPVPIEFFDAFCSTVMLGTSNPQESIDRARILLPVYRIKWCCILLNDFLPVGIERRQFANRHVNIQEKKNDQLLKAKAALKLLD